MLLAVLAGIVMLGGAAAVHAAGVPWAQNKDEDAAGAGSADLETALGQAQYNRLVSSVEAKLKMSEQAMQAHNKEMEKPIDKRNERLLLACKERAATGYVGAALAAKQAAARHRDEAVKAAIQEKFQKPNEQKAIDIYAELALKAQDAGNVKMAVAYYRRILGIDAENAQAKEALVQIAKQIQEAGRTGAAGGSKGGGSEDTRRSWERDKDYSGTKGKHYNDGRGSW
jgi:hypothetical protein